MARAIEQPAVAPPLTVEERGESYGTLVWRKFRKSKIAIVGALLTAMLVFMAIFADFLSPSDPTAMDMQQAYTRPQTLYFIDANGNFSLRPFTFVQKQVLDPATFLPTWQPDLTKPYPLRFFVPGYQYKILGVIPSNIHLYGVEEGGTVYILGTDKFGRDLWGRICTAGRISISLALFGTFISITIGSAVGIASGYYGGWIDNLIQRFIEFLQSFPALPLWMALAAIIPITWDQTLIFVTMSAIFAILGWTLLARELRGKVLALRETDFVLAAKEMGASDRRIIFRHLLPNCLSHIIVITSLTIPGIILAESFLSSIGIGIQEPLVSWGGLMREAQSLQTLGSNPWLMAPVAFIVLAVLGFNFLGDGLRDAVDPYSIV
ncbi:MAG: ABC transporter permease [Chloroflexales bacterium]|nr:ABC transporter permease [Chloroflexales bacterium]